MARPFPAKPLALACVAVMGLSVANAASPAPSSPPRPAPPMLGKAKEVKGAWTARAPRSDALRMDTAMIAYPIREPSGPVAIRDVSVDMSKSFLTNVAYPNKPAAPVIGLTIERVKAACYKCVILARDSSGTVIRDAQFTGTWPRKFAAGIQLGGTAHGILIERVELSNFTAAEPAGYPNADGLSAEKGNYDILIRDSFSHDNTDGCFDLKSTSTRLENVWAARCGRNYRFWSDIRATTLHSDSPAKSHIWVSRGASPVVDRLVATGSGLIAQVEQGGTLTIKSCDLSGWKGERKFEGDVQAGPGC